MKGGVKTTLFFTIIMKTLIISLLILLYAQSFAAQNVNLNNINSKNVLEFFGQKQTVQNYTLSNNVGYTLQKGDNNLIHMMDQTPGYINLVQSGNQNTTLFINTNNYPTNAEIKINGSRNYIDIVGSNSISDGMKMNINANDMTLFMRNY